MTEQPRVNPDGGQGRPPALSSPAASRTAHVEGRFANQQNFLDAFHDPVVIVDDHGLIVRINAATVRAFGYAEETLLEQAIEALFPESYRRLQVEQWTNYFSAPSSRPIGQDLQLRGQRQNGEEFPVDVSLNPIWDQGQLFVICVIHDVTERQQRDIKLRDTEARYRRELAQAALLDKLTGLPNRALLMDRLQMTIDRARQAETNYAAMFLDFDRFKFINDSLGHDVGDALLCEIAARLRGQLRTSDTVSRFVSGPSAARMGGDEFVVLLDELRNPSDATAVAQRLLDSFSQPYQLGQHEVFSSASIGIVVGNASYDRAEDVLRDADTAMYEAKRAGRARYIVFDDTMHQRVQRRLRLETDLRKAIDSEQLSLVYQPIVSLDTGEVKSTEALLRWNHPDHGPISPAEFIPIAEESELILAVGDWVLREGVRQMADWVARLGNAAPPTVSINLSRKQFIRSNLPQMIESVAAKAGLSPTRLQFEITEDTFASDVKAAIAAMNSIKSLGSSIAIDDFGTGSSSFASVHQFPADVLKIDRSLLTSIEVSKDTAALVHSLAILVRNLDMTMVAEGVETQSHVVTLQELGCQYAQGYFFAQPMPTADFEEYLLKRYATRRTVVGAEVFQDRWSELLHFSTKWMKDERGQ